MAEEGRVVFPAQPGLEYFLGDTCHAHTSLLPFLLRDKREGILCFLAVFLFHFPALTFVIQGAGHLPVTTLGGWHLIFVIIFVSFATGNVDMLAVRKENP